MKKRIFDLLKFSTAFAVAGILALGTTAQADTYNGAGVGDKWETDANWAGGSVPANNSSNILINGGHDVIYDTATWDYLQTNSLAQSSTQHRVARWLINENTGAGAIGDNSITFDFADPGGAARQVLATNTSSAIFGSRPSGITTINVDSGEINTGARTSFGARAGGTGILNLNSDDSVFIVGRSNLQLGYTNAGGTNGTGIANITRGTLRTREGLGIGATSEFNVFGSTATEIGIGSQGSVDGFYNQLENGILSVGLDAGGVTDILIDDSDDNGTGGAATFASGSILDASDLGGWSPNVWETVLEAEGGITDNGLVLSAASLAAGWEKQIITSGGSDLLQVRLVAVPEPSSLALLGLGGLFFAGRRRRNA